MDHSVVFGLYGPWGSGKTSTLNMVREELQKSGTHPTIVDFNPWRYCPSDNLIEPFLALLSEGIQRGATTGKIKKSAKRLLKMIRRYSSVLSTTAGLFKSVPGVNLAQSLLAWCGKERTVSPGELKERIARQLKDADMRVVVFIDDLDRLPSEAIRSVFQLVAAVANFPGVSYLIAYDPNNVISALETVQGCDGEQYLEKIVQVPIELREPSYGGLVDICEAGVNELLDGVSFESDEADEIGRCLGMIVERVKTVRDARRLLNVFEVDLAEADDKIAPSDILAMTALRLFAPKLMPWLSAHRFMLAGGVHVGFSSAKEAEERKDACEREIFERLDGDELAASLAFNLLCFSFPHFKYYCGELVAGVSEEMLRLHRRIACPEILDRYLSGMLDSYEFPREGAARLIQSGTAEELEALFAKEDDGVATTVMMVASELAPEMDSAQIENVVRALLRSSAKGARLLHRRFSVRGSAFEQLLRALGTERAGKILLDETSGLGFSAYAAIASFVRLQQIVYEKSTGGPWSSSEPLISSECLTRIGLNIVEALERTGVQASDLAIDGAQTLLYLWRGLDEESYTRRVTNGVLQEPLGRAIYESYRLGSYASSEERGFAFPGSIPEDVDFAEVASCVAGLPYSEEFWRLPLEWRRRIIALGICAEKIVRGADYLDAKASEKEVERRLGQPPSNVKTSAQES